MNSFSSNSFNYLNSFSLTPLCKSFIYQLCTVIVFLSVNHNILIHDLLVCLFFILLSFLFFSSSLFLSLLPASSYLASFLLSPLFLIFGIRLYPAIPPWSPNPFYLRSCLFKRFISPLICRRALLLRYTRVKANQLFHSGMASSWK